MIQLFFSYAHKDEAMRDELEIHLATLKRQGIIEAWHDRRITVGTDLDNSISEYLEQSDVILLLVSPHFLASEYCYEKEATRALERHANKEAVVIPVVLEPCDWKNTPIGKLLATPRDGKPISKYPNHNDAYLEVVTEIRRVAEEFGKATAPRSTPEPSASVTTSVQPRSSNLRMKKSFSDRDKDSFLDEAMNYIRNFFGYSLEELSARNHGVEHRIRDDGDNAFAAYIYVGGQKKSSCRIWQGGRNAFGDISYSGSDTGTGVNESLSLHTDGYQLGFKAMGIGIIGHRSDTLLSMPGAAEHFWSMFISRLQ